MKWNELKETACRHVLCFISCVINLAVFTRASSLSASVFPLLRQGEGHSEPALVRQ